MASYQVPNFCFLHGKGRHKGGKRKRGQFTPSLAFHVRQVGSGLVSQYLLAKSIEPALLAIVAGVRFHQFHPLSMGGIRWFSPFPLLPILRERVLPAKRLLFEENLRKKAPSHPNRRKRQKTPGGSQTHRAQWQAI